MGLFVNFGTKGVSLREINKAFAYAMEKYANSTSKVSQEVAECSGKTASEIADMVSKKDSVVLSAKNKILETPYAEMDLRHNAAYNGLHGETKNKVYSDGATEEIKRFFNLKDNSPAFISRKTNFADGARRNYVEHFGNTPSKAVVSTAKKGERSYQKFVDSQGRNISYVNYIDSQQVGYRRATQGTFHIDNAKIKFERVKDETGQYTDAYKAQIKNGATTETLMFDNYEQLAKHLKVGEHHFWSHN